jgi:23S rRNA (pseudouridine1915-N3)-methyltransferase
MRVKLICVGKIKEPYLKDGINHFLTRLKPFTKLEVIEIKNQGSKKEGDSILEKLDDEFVVIMDEKGKEYTSREFAFFFKGVDQDITFIIGGPYGLSSDVKDRADATISLSQMTFTREMARLFLLEQLYRVFTILKGKSYHKG